MARPQTIEAIAGTTIKFTYASSGAVPTSISAALIDKNEALVSSQTAVGSLTNFYAFIQLPNTPGWYVNEWKATIQGLNYVDRQFVRLRSLTAQGT